jgi:glycosyltransferase involved in cell wall biosynthesis
MGIERPSGRRYFHIARELVRRGHAVRILALHPDLETCDQHRLRCQGVEVWYVGQMHARKRDGVTTRFTAWQLVRVLVESICGMIWGIVCSPADVYHIGKPQPVNGIAALLGVLLLRWRGFYLDCDDDEVTSSHFTAQWQRAIFAFWQWFLPRIALGVTVNTRFLVARIHASSRMPVVHVPNGVDLDTFQCPPPAVLQGLRTALGLHGRQVVAYTGTLTIFNHPVDLLVDAFALVAREVPEATLLLIGGGADLTLLRKQAANLGIQSSIIFTGYVPHAAVRAYLALSDMSVDPVFDNDVARARSPLKIFESLALGVPVVTGDVGDRAALLDYERAGVLVQPGSASALAEGITALLTDETRRDQLAQASQQHARRYDWRFLAAQWESVYAASGETGNRSVQ